MALVVKKRKMTLVYTDGRKFNEKLEELIPHKLLPLIPWKIWDEESSFEEPDLDVWLHNDKVKFSFGRALPRICLLYRSVEEAEKVMEELKSLGSELPFLLTVLKNRWLAFHGRTPAGAELIEKQCSPVLDWGDRKFELLIDEELFVFHQLSQLVEKLMTLRDSELERLRVPFMKVARELELPKTAKALEKRSFCRVLSKLEEELETAPPQVWVAVETAAQTILAMLEALPEENDIKTKEDEEAREELP